MPLLGAHMSIAGGVEKSVLHAASVNCTCLQIFTASNNRWEGKFPGGNSIKLFREYLRSYNIAPVVSHNSYLPNLASPDSALYDKSILGLLEELKRCDALEIPYLVIHPGAATDGNRGKGIKRIVKAVRKIIRRTRQIDTAICFENTSGQGTTIGNTFEELAALFCGVDMPARTGICLDTCHLFAAGVDFLTKAKYRAMMKAFDSEIGMSHLKVIHFNDSKQPFGSRKDRHEHIGKGYIGKKPFGFFLNDRKLTGIPKILETPKGKDLKEDVENLKTLRSLLR